MVLSAVKSQSSLLHYIEFSFFFHSKFPEPPFHDIISIVLFKLSSNNCVVMFLNYLITLLQSNFIC